MKLEGGFLVLYNGMEVKRLILDNKIRVLPFYFFYNGSRDFFNQEKFFICFFIRKVK